VPGDSVSSIAIVSNHLDHAVVLDTYVVDGLTSATGAFALNAQTAPRVGVGLWATSSAKQITVAANSEQKVPFTLAVPKGTKPGDYAGGLIIASAPVAGATTKSNNTAVRINIIERQGARIYLTVPGKTVLGLVTHPLKWAWKGGHVSLSFAMTNTGNITLHPTASIRVQRWLGDSTALRLTPPESVPPGATVTMTSQYPASAWAQIASASATVHSAAGTSASAATIFALSAPLLIGVLVVFLLLGFAAWRIAIFVRRARRALAHFKGAQTNAAQPNAAQPNGAQTNEAQTNEAPATQAQPAFESASTVS
jgi:Sec-independent protein translocase protein TatA